MVEEYIIICDGEIIKSYKNFKQAEWDVRFYELIYKDVCIYKLVLKNGEPV